MVSFTRIGAALALVALSFGPVDASHKPVPPGHKEVMPDKCPLIGSRPDGSPPAQKEQILNPKKNRRTAPPASSIDASVTLERMLAPGNDRGRFSESKGAEITGFIVKVEQGGHPETANCGNLTEQFTDTHITVALQSTTDLTQTLVVEVTPWWRQQMAKQGMDWSTATLSQTIVGKRVKFRGWLLFDIDHIGQAENLVSGNPKNWRKTIWEIHPITSMEVIN